MNRNEQEWAGMNRNEQIIRWIAARRQDSVVNKGHDEHAHVRWVAYQRSVEKGKNIEYRVGKVFSVASKKTILK